MSRIRLVLAVMFTSLIVSASSLAYDEGIAVVMEGEGFEDLSLHHSGAQIDGDHLVWTLYDLLGVEGDSCWVNLHPQVLENNLVSQNLVSSPAGEWLVRMDLRLKEDAGRLIKEAGLELGNGISLRWWIEPNTAWVTEAEEAFGVFEVRFKVNYQVYGPVDEETALVLETIREKLESRLNSRDREYEELRDFYRLWLISRWLRTRIDLEEIDPSVGGLISWNKRRCLDTYLRPGLEAGAPLMGGIYLSSPNTVRVFPAHHISPQRIKVRDYLRLGIFGLHLGEPYRSPEGKKVLSISLFPRFRGEGQEERKVSAEQVFVLWDGSEFVGEVWGELASDWGSWVEKVFRGWLAQACKSNGITEVGVYRLSDSYHDIYGAIVVEPRTKQTHILLSPECFSQNQDLNETGRYVLLHELLHLWTLLSQIKVDILKGKDGIAIRVRGRGFSKEVDKSYLAQRYGSDLVVKRWQKLFRSYLGFSASRIKNERSLYEEVVEILGIFFLAYTGEDFGKALSWMYTGRGLILSRLEALPGEVRGFLLGLNEELSNVPVRLRLGILRMAVVNRSFPDGARTIREWMKKALSSVAPEKVSSAFRELSDRQKRVVYSFLSAMLYHRIVQPFSVIANHPELYEEFFQNVSQWLEAQKDFHRFGKRGYRLFYSALGDVLVAPKLVRTWLALNPDPKKLAIIGKKVPAYKVLEIFLTWYFIEQKDALFFDSEERLIASEKERLRFLQRTTEGEVQFTIPVQGRVEWRRRALIGLVEAGLVESPLKSRLLRLVRSGKLDLSVVKVPYTVFSAPVYLDPERALVAIPDVYWGEEGLTKEGKALLLFGLIDLALKRGLEIRGLLDLEDASKMQLLSWRHAYNRYKAGETSPMAWFLFSVFFNEALTEQLLSALAGKALFMAGRFSDERRWPDGFRYARDLKEELLAKGEAGRLVRYLPPFRLSVSQEKYRRASRQGYDYLIGLLKGETPLADFLREEPWFRWWTGYAKGLYDTIENAPGIIKQRICNGLLISLADALSFSGLPLKDVPEEVVEDIRLLYNVSDAVSVKSVKVAWDVVIKSREEVLRRLKEGRKEKEKGGVLLMGSDGL